VREKVERQKSRQQQKSIAEKKMAPSRERGDPCMEWQASKIPEKKKEICLLCKRIHPVPRQQAVQAV